MRDRLLESIKRLADAVSQRCSERLFARRYARMQEHNGTHLGAVWLFVVSLSGCAHGPTTRTLTAAHHGALAACEADFARVEAEATNDADSQRELNAASVRCMDSLRAICTEHGTCGEVFR